MARRIGASAANAVIVGEPGTGKEDLARVLCAAAVSAHQAPIVVPGRSRTDDAAVSALFALEEAASAPGKSVILEDVSELPWELQGRLARTIVPVPGASVAVGALRVVATSTRDLLPLVGAGTFRRDLFDALSFSIRLPPRRERREDVLAVAERAWASLGERRVLAEGARDLIRQYDWPGYARELVAFMARLARRSCTCVITVRDVERELFMMTTGLSCWGPPEAPLALEPTAASGDGTGAGPREVLLEAERALSRPDQVDLPSTLRAIETGLIDWALMRAGGSRTEAAQLLGIRRTTLVEKLRRRRDAGGDPGAGAAFREGALPETGGDRRAG
jgi:DNA-binding NtrC family response regulator